MPGFMFCTGIENSYPTIALPDGSTRRIDEMEKIGHYARWRDDFQLVDDLGIRYLRYGPPYYRAHLGPGRYDWSFADETFAALRQMNIIPIADLCHFGVPDWVGSFQNPDWPELFAEYAAAFAERFPWVRLYTPINEIFVLAKNSAERGWWNERLQSDRAFVTALKHLCQANVLAMRAILTADRGDRPGPTFIQSESTEYFHSKTPDCRSKAYFLNQKRFLSLDLTYGRPLSAPLYEYVLDNGMTREEYHWFAEHQVRAHCVMGNDYYVCSEHLVAEDGSYSPSGEIFGYYVITRQYFERYRLPVMHTETNIDDSQARWWLQKEWANAHRLKQDGVPLLGFTWYSLTDIVDWNTSLREDAGQVVTTGLCDLDRKLRPVGEDYRELISRWREPLSVESRGLLLTAEA